MTDITAAARISAYVAERKRHLDARADVIHGFGLGPDAKVLRASDVRAVLADLTGLTRPERCQDCATDPAGPCGICAIAIYGDVDGLAYLDARDERDRLKERTALQEQALRLAHAQTAECLTEVDAALGHRYHKPGIHYSIPHIAEKAAAELRERTAERDRLKARIDHALAELLRGGQDHGDARRAAIGVLHDELPADNRAEAARLLAEKSTELAEQRTTRGDRSCRCRFICGQWDNCRKGNGHA